MRIRPPMPEETERLREIAAASKGSWGYKPERVRKWAAGLDFSSEQMRRSELYVAEVNDRLIGWAALIPPAGEVCVLDHLWVEPEVMGKGIGARLFAHAAERAAELGARALEWEAEPNSVGFYEKMGGRHVRDAMSEWGRVLPVMAIDLTHAAVTRSGLSSSP